MPRRAQLDHIILLLPYKDVVDPPDWITQHFTVSPGGRHADDKTENKLVLFADGSYLELVAFIEDDPKRREGHWWDKPYGIVDYALTTVDTAFPELADISSRLSQTDTGISYEAPREGGRIRPDGVELKWRVTFPSGVQRGLAPFFCHDVTPRNRRVPLTESATRHPAGVTALGGVLLEVPEVALKRVQSATAAILDSTSNELDFVHEISNVKRPSVRVESATGSGAQDSIISLLVQTEKEVPAIRHKIGDGLVSIIFE